MGCPYWAEHFHRFLRGRKLAKSAGGGITEKSRGRDASPRPPARRPILGLQRGWTCRSIDAPSLRLREWRRQAWGLMRVMTGAVVRAPGRNAREAGCAAAGSAALSVGRHGSGSAKVVVMLAGWQREGVADALRLTRPYHTRGVSPLRRRPEAFRSPPGPLRADT